MDIVKQDYNNNYLHSNIRLLRKRMRWSQEELAKKIGLNRGNIASYENGSAEPKICNLLKLASLFDVPIKTLTQFDLSDQADVTSLPQTQESKPPVYCPDAMRMHQQRAKELEDLMQGLNTCCRYKLKSMGEGLPKDVKVIVMHYEQLFDAAQSLLNEYHSLLDRVGNPKA